MYSFNNNRTIFILNPNAGNSDIYHLARKLGKFTAEFDFVVIPGIEEFRTFMQEHRNSYDIFIAAGGDGTVNSVASELLFTEKILGVFPIGSGNGFAREMGFKKKLRNLVKDIRNERSFEIDVLLFNDTPCINVSGIGMDSFVAHEFHNMNRRGMWNYGISAWKVVRKIKPFNVQLTIGEKEIHEKIYMFSAANTRQFGNNAIVAPMAKPDDGKFNLVLLKPCPRILIFVLFIQMLTGTLKESKYLKYLESENKIFIKSDESRVHIDGEPLIIETTIPIEIKKNALRILRSSFNKRIKSEIN